MQGCCKLLNLLKKAVISKCYKAKSNKHSRSILGIFLLKLNTFYDSATPNCIPTKRTGMITKKHVQENSYKCYS